MGAEDIIVACGLAEEKYLLTGALSGTIECPKCGKEASYVTNAVRHNYTINCSTEGCLSAHADGKPRSAKEDEELRQQLLADEGTEGK